MDYLVDILGCHLGSLPMKYLRLPIGAAYKEKAIWNPILEKEEKRLAGWKRLYLFKGGSVTLIKALSLAFQRISFLFSLCRLVWSTVLKSFKEISFGEAVGRRNVFIWLVRIRFVCLFSMVHWPLKLLIVQPSPFREMDLVFCHGTGFTLKESY